MLKCNNNNYCAVVCEIKTLVPLAGCDFVQHAIIMGNNVVVGKDVKIGDIGVFFPVETQLSEPYLKTNNLYRKAELNSDNTKKGYFDENGRIRCVKFRGYKSEGLFMPWQSLLFTGFVKSDWTKVEGLIGTPLNLGDEFDELEGIQICRKYIPKQEKRSDHVRHKKGKGFKKYELKLIDKQFNFHQDTSQLYKNLHKINPDSLISISYKLHGTSLVSSKILCKKPLKWYEKVLKKIGVNVVDTEYDFVYSSRKVIKNAELNKTEHYYDTDIWGLAHDRIKDFLLDGMSAYCEIVGFTPSGAGIQGKYDYGCEPGKFDVYIYRITYTNSSGKVFEFSARQVQDFCKEKGLKAVPQLFYGYAKEMTSINPIGVLEENLSYWRDDFLNQIKKKYNEKDCYISKNQVPEEGAVIRVEGNQFEAYKCKSSRFYLYETSELDKGTVNIEDEN